MTFLRVRQNYDYLPLIDDPLTALPSTAPRPTHQPRRCHRMGPRRLCHGAGGRHGSGGCFAAAVRQQRYEPLPEPDVAGRVAGLAAPPAARTRGARAGPHWWQCVLSKIHRRRQSRSGLAGEDSVDRSGKHVEVEFGKADKQDLR